MEKASGGREDAARWATGQAAALLALAPSRKEVLGDDVDLGFPDPLAHAFSIWRLAPS